MVGNISICLHYGFSSFGVYLSYKSTLYLIHQDQLFELGVFGFSLSRGYCRISGPDNHHKWDWR